MEQICMIAVFAVAAAICLRGFALAHEISEGRSDLDAAVLLAQDTCEILKYTEGDVDKAAEFLGGRVTDDGLIAYYDGNKMKTSRKKAVYVVKVSPSSSEDGVGAAEVEVSSEGKVIYGLTVAWQEEQQ